MIYARKVSYREVSRTLWDHGTERHIPLKVIDQYSLCQNTCKFSLRVKTRLNQVNERFQCLLSMVPGFQPRYLKNRNVLLILNTIPIVLERNLKDLKIYVSLVSVANLLTTKASELQCTLRLQKKQSLLSLQKRI